MTNWKTTISGIALLAAAGFFAFTGNLPLAGVCLPAGVGLLAAKDYDKK